jgi:hypothetical protein
MQRVSTRATFTTIIALLVLFAGGVTGATAGTLKVTSFPTGAQVIVDGVTTGKLTPMKSASPTATTSSPSRSPARAGTLIRAP